MQKINLYRMPKILPDKSLSKLDSYKLLKAYQKQITEVSIKEHFKKEHDRLNTRGWIGKI